jgi:hypothetical protein
VKGDGSAVVTIGYLERVFNLVLGSGAIAFGTGFWWFSLVTGLNRLCELELARDENRSNVVCRLVHSVYRNGPYGPSKTPSVSWPNPRHSFFVISLSIHTK